MPMNVNASERSDVLRETAHVQEHRAHPSGDTVPEEHRSHRQAPPRNSVGPHAPGEGTFETFAGGAGI
jgi:hypothetical protein